MHTCDCSEYDYKMFRCADCGSCTNCSFEYYMVHDAIWAAAYKKKREMLCIGCLEVRRGKLLTKNDFTDAPINSMALIVGSTRLKHRLTNKKASAILKS